MLYKVRETSVKVTEMTEGNGQYLLSTWCLNLLSEFYTRETTVHSFIHAFTETPSGKVSQPPSLCSRAGIRTHMSYLLMQVLN